MKQEVLVFFPLIKSIFCLTEDTVSTGEEKQEVKCSFGRKAGAEDAGRTLLPSSVDQLDRRSGR